MIGYRPMGTNAGAIVYDAGEPYGIVLPRCRGIPVHPRLAGS